MAESRKTQKPSDNDIKKCGIVMPISAMDTYSAQHWEDVNNIISDVIKSADFEAGLVSDADDVGVIQKRIVQSLYTNEIVVCDVSGKNPNVMFELGMRIAFSKPVVIIVDDITLKALPFDTASIEHVIYPRDLRFNKIVEFKEKLKAKIISTYESEEPTILQSLGSFSVPDISTDKVAIDEYLLNEVRDIKRQISRLNTSSLRMSPELNRTLDRDSFTLLPELIKDFITLVKKEEPGLSHSALVDRVFDIYIHNIPLRDRLSILEDQEYLKLSIKKLIKSNDL